MKNKKFLITLFVVLFVSINHTYAMAPESHTGSDESIMELTKNSHGGSDDSIQELRDILRTSIPFDDDDDDTKLNKRLPRNSMEDIMDEINKETITFKKNFKKTTLSPDATIALRTAPDPRFTQITLHHYRLEIDDKQKLQLIIDEEAQKDANIKKLNENFELLRTACIATLFLQTNDGTKNPFLESLIRQCKFLFQDINKLPKDPKKRRTAKDDIHKKHIFPAVEILEAALKKGSE